MTAKTIKRLAKETKLLFRELPYHGFNFNDFHGRFNNSLITSLPTKKYLDRLTSLHDLNLFNLNIDSNANPDRNLNIQPIQCKYYSPHSFSQSIREQNSASSHDSNFSLLHNNVRSLQRNLENFQVHLLDELQLHFDVIGVTETKITNSNIPLDFDPSIPNYNFEYIPTPLSAGGVGMYIDNGLKYTVAERTSNQAFQALWITIHFANKRDLICGVIYRQHNCPEKFLNYLDETLERLSTSGKPIYIMTDANINLLRYETCKYAQNFLHTLQSLCFTPTIDKPTRVYNTSATLIDNIFVNNYDMHILSGNIVSDISDHFSQFCVCRSLGRKIKPRKIVSRDTSKFSEEKFVNDLSQLHWESILSESSNDVNKSFSTFYNKLNRIVNKHASINTVSKRKAKQLNKPWITRGLRISIKKKNELFFSGNKSKYKIYRNKILTLSRLSKKLYYHDYFMTNSNNIKRTWDGINMLINRKRKSENSITALKRPGNRGISYHTFELPSILNNHFASVGPNLASKIP